MSNRRSEFQKWATAVIAGQDPELAARRIVELSAAAKSANALSAAFIRLANIAWLERNPTLAARYMAKAKEFSGLAEALEQLTL